MNETLLPRNRRLALCAIACLVLLLLSPNLVWLWYAHGFAVWVNALILPTILLLTFFALLGDWPWLACLLLVPFAVLAPLEAFYISVYHRPTFAEVLATIIASNPRETREYLGGALVPAVLSVLAALLLALLTTWWSRRTELRWSHRSRLWVLLIVVVTSLVSMILIAFMAHGNGPARSRKEAPPLAVLSTAIRNGFPFGMIQRFADYYTQWSAMRDTAARLDSYRFHAHRLGEISRRQVYVLVIGESSRRDHWQLFGYDRATNPELTHVSNLVPIPDMLAAWPESIAAIPMIITRKPAGDQSIGWNEASILRAMQEAGFETWWISNQMAIGKFDSPISIYASEAQHKVYLNHASDEAAGSYDEALLQPLRDALHDSNHDLFIVLHMMGSHLMYDLRYPISFEHFRPTYSDVESNVLQGLRMRNSYDNTILYTDHVLASIIGILHDNDAVTAMWYESDHGETLPTPTCSIAGHGVGSRSDFQIPALFWYSNAYASMFPKRVSALRANSGKRVMSADTFESTIDMAGLDYPGRDATQSLLSQQWQYKPRIVNSIWQTDFDTSISDDGCGVVLPEKKG